MNTHEKISNPHLPSTLANAYLGFYPLLLYQVANKDVDMAIGGDQGGSIRMPAAACGIMGLKPTFGLVPYTGIVSIDPTIDHTGPMARTVYDTALLLEVFCIFW